MVGFCLGESLVAPFHCADVEEKEKDRLVAEFRAGTIKTLLATNTLSQGVNTPADVVVVCGTRRGSYYLDGPEVAQIIGRAGRGKDEARAYILGDKIEIFNAKKSLLARSLPLPVESMMLTSLSLHCATKEDLAKALNKTYAASMTTYEKVMDSVERYLRFLKACNILLEKDSVVFSLTKEGSLLARYYISPGSYIGFMRAARRLETSDFSETDRGCLLLSSVLPIGVFPEYPARLEKDFHMKLLPLELDKDFSSQKAAAIKFYLIRASAIPPYLPYQLRDVQRWIKLFNDLEKYGVHERTPGKGWLLKVVIALKTNAAKAASKKKPIQPSLV